MSQPLTSAHELYISIGFINGEIVFGTDGEHPGDATLTADITAGLDGWTIATVYLGNMGRDRPYEAITGKYAEVAKKMLLADDDFNDWAATHCRSLEASARAAARCNDLIRELGDHLHRTRQFA